MEPRQILLFVHLLSMAAYFMALGTEFFGALLAGQEREGHGKGIAMAKAGCKVGHYALLVLFMTGGALINGVKKEEQISFVITLIPFLVIGGLAGMAAGKYKKIATGGNYGALVGPLAMRVALSAGILMLVSAKPNVVTSVGVVVVSVIAGAIAMVGATKRTA